MCRSNLLIFTARICTYHAQATCGEMRENCGTILCSEARCTPIPPHLGTPPFHRRTTSQSQSSTLFGKKSPPTWEHEEGGGRETLWHLSAWAASVDACARPACGRSCPSPLVSRLCLSPRQNSLAVSSLSFTDREFEIVFPRSWFFAMGFSNSWVSWFTSLHKVPRTWVGRGPCSLSCCSQSWEHRHRYLHRCQPWGPMCAEQRQMLHNA